mgnify:CR=1 FL=1
MVSEIEMDDCIFSNMDITAAMGGVSVDAAQALDGYDMDLEADLGSVHVNNRSEEPYAHQAYSSQPPPVS